MGRYPVGVYACVWHVYVAARLAQLPEQQPRPMQLQQRHAYGAADGGDGQAELGRREAAWFGLGLGLGLG